MIQWIYEKAVAVLGQAQTCTALWEQSPGCGAEAEAAVSTFLAPLTPVPVPGRADAALGCPGATAPTGWLPAPSSGWNIHSKY